MRSPWELRWQLEQAWQTKTIFDAAEANRSQQQQQQPAAAAVLVLVGSEGAGWEANDSMVP